MGKKIICFAILVAVTLIVFIGRDRIMGNYKGDHDCVDLGLPSGIKWATCNVGATKPTEYGYYFSWGETNPKSDFSESTYKWTTDGGHTYTKYVTSNKYGTVDNKKVLDATDDAVTANWGSGWRMPTSEEIMELIDGCTWKWTTNYNGSGVAGRIGTSKANGNTIFLPAAGFCCGSRLVCDCKGGYYWSSSLNEYYSDKAYYLVFSDDDIFWISSDRYYGRSVRAVYEDLNTVQAER